MIKKRSVSIEKRVENSVNRLISFSKINLEGIYKELNTDINGIATKDVEDRVEKYGLNQVAHERPTPW